MKMSWIFFAGSIALLGSELASGSEVNLIDKTVKVAQADDRDQKRRHDSRDQRHQGHNRDQHRNRHGHRQHDRGDRNRLRNPYADDNKDRQRNHDRDHRREHRDGGKHDGGKHEWRHDDRRDHRHREQHHRNAHRDHHRSDRYRWEHSHYHGHRKFERNYWNKKHHHTRYCSHGHHFDNDFAILASGLILGGILNQTFFDGGYYYYGADRWGECYKVTIRRGRESYIEVPRYRCY